MCEVKRRDKLRPEQTAVLEKWWQAHIDDPYPSAEEKEILAEDTELSVKQVNYWFVNMRKRRNRKIKMASPNKEKVTITGARGGKHINFTPEQVAIMDEWGRSHWNYPYPTMHEKTKLAEETKLTYDQVQHWYINWRMRIWRPKNRLLTSTPPVEPIRLRLSDFRVTR